MKINNRITSIILPAFLVVLSCNTVPEQKAEQVKVVRQMAEFEDIDAIRLIWSTYDHKEGESVEKVTLGIINALVRNTKIVISCADEAVRDTARTVLANRYPDLTNLVFEVVPSVEIWVRDMGPVFVETENGDYAIADFNFNSWGYTDTLDTATRVEEKYDERVAQLLGLPIVSSSMISEGGNREVNGKGTLLVTEAVEQGRNPKMSKAEMETEYKRLLGVKKVIWLKEGVVEDQHTFLGPLSIAEGTLAYTVWTTNGHIDEYARFANDSTILLAQVDSADFADPIAWENHRRLEENYYILSNSTDQEGRPFTIVRMPMPITVLDTMTPGDYAYDGIAELDYQNGHKFPVGEEVTTVAAASYLNFIITNTVIVGQKYWRPGMTQEVKNRDDQVRGTLEAVFPGKKVVLLDALAVNLSGGGLHCISMHQPKIKK